MQPLDEWQWSTEGNRMVVAGSSRSALLLSSQRRGEFFESWAEYLSKRSHQGARLFELIHENTRRVVLPKSERREGATGILPWPTFVVGSGCLSLSDRRGPQDPDDAAIVLRNALERVLGPDQSLVLFVMDYVDGLARSRVGRALEMAGLAPVSRDATEWDYVVRVVVVAALLTQLFGTAISASPQPIGTRDRDSVELPQDSWEWPRFENEIVAPLRHWLESLRTAGDSDGGSRGSVAAFCARVLGVLDSVDGRPARVRRSHVELATTYAWYFLTEDTLIYPSWSELVQFAAFQDPVETPPYDSSVRPSPKNRLQTKAEEVLSARLLEITKESWRTQWHAANTMRDSLYDSVASIVFDQAEKASQLPRSVREAPPLPTIFVSSFDVELEMALWESALPTSGAAAGRTFIVVLPVLAIDQLSSSTRDASLHWVWREVVPEPGSESEELDRLLGVTAEESEIVWRELTGQEDFLDPTAPNFRAVPIVVRIAGSPLMRVTGANTEMRARSSAAQRKSPEPLMRQALAFDEYTAVNQTVLDIVNAMQSGGGGLPAALTGDTAPGIRRFWMLLGAQIADPAIRMRLFAQGFSPAIYIDGKTAGEDGQDLAVSAGVVVNRRSSAGDRITPQWLALDVVEGDLSSLVGPLSELLDDLRRSPVATGATT